MNWYVPAPSDAEATPDRTAGAVGCGAATLDRSPSPRGVMRDRSLTDRPAIGSLGGLLQEAANLEVTDRNGWSLLAAEAAPVIDVLIAQGVVPHHLAVRAGEPPVVVRRTVAAAWRHATDGQR